jgi:regulator of protease activity HflC (stomatin/prohibitin superfamily)
MIKELINQILKLFTWLVIVAPWEQALRVRLGKRVRLLTAGTYFSIPFMDRVYRQSIRHRLTVIPPQILTSKDGKAISVGGAVGYAIADLQKLYNTLHNPDDTIQSAVAACVAEYVANHPAVECIPSDIETAVSQNLRLEEYGLTTGEFYITNFAVVRTLRVITGEIRGWSTGGIDTSSHVVAGMPQ